MADLWLVFVIREIHNDEEQAWIILCFINDNSIYLSLENSSKYMWIAYNLVYALVPTGIHSPWILPLPYF